MDPDELHVFAERFMLGHEDADLAVDKLFDAEREIRRLRGLLESVRKAVDYVGGDESVRNICRKAGLVMRHEPGGETFEWSAVHRGPR
jgi:hypothetical protein